MLAREFLALSKMSGNFVLTGDDIYLKDKVLSHVKSLLPEGIVEFNFNSIEGGKDIGRELVDTLNLAPAFSAFRVVYVKELREKLTKDSIDLIKGYLDDANPTSILIVNDEKNVLGTLKKRFDIIDCSSYTSGDSVDFVKRHTIELGGTINPAAAKLLSEYCQYDMMRIDVEIRKLIEFKEGGTITELDVAECVHADVDYEIYEIANAVGDKDLNKALDVIHTLIEAGLKPSDVLGQLSRAFRRMLYVKISPLSNTELATILEIKPFAVSKTKERINKFTPVKLKEIYDNINEMEFKFKSGVMTDSSALDDALVKIFV